MFLHLIGSIKKIGNIFFTKLDYCEVDMMKKEIYCINYNKVKRFYVGN